MNTRWIGFAALGICILGGLIAGVFSRSIEAALTTAAPTPDAMNWVPTPPIATPGAINRGRHPGDSVPTPPIAGVPSVPSPVPGSMQILAQDTFSRADQGFWGTASDGRVWGGDANGKSIFSIVRDAGQIDPGQGTYNAILGPMSTNAEVVFSASVNHFNPKTANIGAVLRWTDSNNWYKAFIDGTELVILRRFQGSSVRLGAVPFIAQAGISYSLRFRVVGGALFARAWKSDSAEPGNWMLMVTDTTLPLLQGYGGVRVALQNDIVARVTSFLETTVPEMI